MKLFLRAAIALILMPLCAHAVPVTLHVADANGQPIAGANVEYADYADITLEKPAVAQNAKSSDDGTLSLDLRGVSGRAGEVVFQVNGKNVLGSARVRDEKLGYGIVPLLAGENTLTLQESARVAGIVRDANGAPLADAQVQFVSAEKGENVYFYGAAQYGITPVITTTNAAGHWEIADLPRGYAEFMVSPPGFAKQYSEFLIDKTEMAAPELKMRVAGIVRGRVVNFGGQPVSGVTIYLSDHSGAVTTSDGEGRFELAGVSVGESTLGFNSSEPNWTGIAGEIKAKIPAQNAVVDIGDVRADEGVLLTGSVVDDVTKAPVANVKLKLDVWGTTLQTDAQGRFEARIQKSFYGLKVQGDYNQKTVVPWLPEGANKFDVGTIEVERVGANFRGRVTDENGAPVSNARVGWNDKSQFNFITPDANGNFEIKGLPFKPLQISASDGTRLTVATSPPDAPVELKLPPAKAPLSDEEIEKLWNELKVRRISDLGRTTEALGARRVFETARRFDAETNPTQIGQGLDDYLSDRARSARTPAERESVAREGVELLNRFDVATWSLGMGEIAMLAAQTDDDELRAWAARWYDAQKTRVRQPDSPDKLEWYHSALTERVMSVGAALGRDDATKYRDIWLSQIDKPHEQNLRQYLPEWGETLWSANPQWFDAIVGEWPASEQMAALTGALKVERNAAKAKELLTRLEKLASDPANVAGDVATTMGSPISKSVEALYRGRTNFARSMALVDASAALDALDKVQAVIQSGDTYEIAAIIARAAIADGQSEIARRALKLGLRDSYTGGSGALTLAIIARPFDAELSSQLMEVGRKNAMSDNAPFEPAGWSDVSAYAIALRDIDAGAGRLILEDQWAKRAQTPAQSTVDEEYAKIMLIRGQEKLAWAMAFYDVERALQWLSEIKDDRNQWNNGLESTRLAILVAALTPPERRYLLLNATYFN